MCEKLQLLETSWRTFLTKHKKLREIPNDVHPDSVKNLKNTEILCCATTSTPNSQEKGPIFHYFQKDTASLQQIYGMLELFNLYKSSCKLGHKTLSGFYRPDAHVYRFSGSRSLFFLLCLPLYPSGGTNRDQNISDIARVVMISCIWPLLSI